MRNRKQVYDAISALEVNQLKKLMELANTGVKLSASDMKTLEKLRIRYEGSRQKSKTKQETEKEKIEKERAEIPIDERIKQLRNRDLFLIEEKQARGETLTESDRKIIREIRAENAENKTVSSTREDVQLSLEKRLQLARLESFEETLRLLRSSKRDDVRMSAAQALKAWADAEEPAQEPYILIDAQPGKECIVNITEALPNPFESKDASVIADAL